MPYRHGTVISDPTLQPTFKWVACQCMVGSNIIIYNYGKSSVNDARDPGTIVTILQRIYTYMGQYTLNFVIIF